MFQFPPGSGVRRASSFLFLGIRVGIPVGYPCPICWLCRLVCYGRFLAGIVRIVLLCFCGCASWPLPFLYVGWWLDFWNCFFVFLVFCVDDCFWFSLVVRPCWVCDTSFHRRLLSFCCWLAGLRFRSLLFLRDLVSKISWFSFLLICNCWFVGLFQGCSCLISIWS